MPVYLFTFHAYRSWTPADPRGYVRHGEEKIRPTNQQMAKWYDRDAKQEPVVWSATDQGILIAAAREMSQHKAYRLHAIVANPSHVHVLASWGGQETQWSHVAHTFKRILGMKLSKAHATTGRRWFSRGGSRKRVRDREHFDHLVSSYLPKHRLQGAQCWFETDGEPAG